MASKNRLLGVLHSPVPYKDFVIVDDGDTAIAPLRDQYTDIVSALPSNPKLGLRCYRGTWVMEDWVPAIIAMQQRFRTRPAGDVVLASPPKCGTTWLKALAFATMSRAVYLPAAGDGGSHPLLRLNPHDCVPFMEGYVAKGLASKIDILPSPRLLATHMHYSILPVSITHNPDCKIVYICREPKDMLVSMWHFRRTIQPNTSFSDVFESACEGSCLSGPIWDHILGYWNASKVSPERVLFLKYEDVQRDTADNVRTLASFLGMPFSHAEEEAGVVTDIVTLCSFDKLKNLQINTTAEVSSIFSNASYFRKGKTGDWVNYMTPEMAHRFDGIIQEKLHGSGLTFT